MTTADDVVNFATQQDLAYMLRPSATGEEVRKALAASILRTQAAEVALTAANQRIAELEGELRDMVEHSSDASHEAIDRFRKVRLEAAETAAASMRERCAAWHDDQALHSGLKAKASLGALHQSYLEREDWHLVSAKLLRSLPLTVSPVPTPPKEATP